jgi:hypothetical protein
VAILGVVEIVAAWAECIPQSSATTVAMPIENKGILFLLIFFEN